MSTIRCQAARLMVWLALGLAAASGAIAAQEPRKSKDVDYSTDKFTGAQHWETTLGNFGDQWKEELKVRKAIVPLKSGAADTSYLFTVLRYGRDWAFLRSPSLWLVDGERLEVGESGDGTEHEQGTVESNQYTGVLVKERAYYRGVTPAFLKQLVRSQSAEFRFPGARDEVQGKFNKKARERLQRFLDAVMPASEQ